MNKKTRSKRGRRLFAVLPGQNLPGRKGSLKTRRPGLSPTTVENPTTSSAPLSRTAVYDKSTRSAVKTADSSPSARAAAEGSTRAERLHRRYVESERTTTGRSVGGRGSGRSGGKGRNRWFFLPFGYAQRLVSEVSHHFLPTKSLIEKKSSGPAADPIELAPFMVRHHGNRRKLSMYEKMYPRTNFLIDSVSQTVGGETSNAGSKFPLTSVSGFNRTGIFYPFGYHDAVANFSTSTQPLHDKHLTYKMGHYTLDDFRQIINQMIDKTGLAETGQHPPTNLPITDADNLLQVLKPLVDGTTKLSIPITDMKTEYELQANSEFLCTHVLIYLVTPRKPVTKMLDPLYAFFRPFTKKVQPNTLAATDANQTLPDNMVFKPSVQSNHGVAITGDQPTNSFASALWDNAAYISTLSTEIVPEASLEDSAEFRENYTVLHKYRICLQPQQMLKFSIHSELNSLTDLMEVLGYDASNPALDHAMWPGKSVFPIIRFWGEDRIASSVGLRRTARPGPTAGFPVTPGTPSPMQTYMGARNKLMDTTSAGPASCQLALTIKKSAGGHFPNLPVNKQLSDALSGIEWGTGTTQAQPISWSFMDCVQQRNKNYYPYDAKERGQSSLYYYVNTNLFDFVDADAGELQPYTGTIVSSVMELDTTTYGIDSSTAGTNWPLANINMASTNDCNNVEIQTVTNKVTQETGSAI